MSDERAAAKRRYVRTPQIGTRVGPPPVTSVKASRNRPGSQTSRCYCLTCGAKKTSGRCTRCPRQPVSPQEAARDH